MIKSIGIDIVENNRIDNSTNEQFINMVLSNKEKDIYNSKVGKKKLEFLCGRFCAKEAIIKCLDDSDRVYMNEIEIINNNKGKPIVNYKNYDFLLSISHEINYSVAQAMLIHKN